MIDGNGMVLIDTRTRLGWGGDTVTGGAGNDTIDRGASDAARVLRNALKITVATGGIDTISDFGTDELMLNWMHTDP